MTNYLSYAKTCLFVLLILIPFGCKKDKPGDTPGPEGKSETFVISMEQPTVQPYQLVELAIGGLRLKNANYNLLIGGTITNLARVNDSVGALVIPDVAPGKHLLEFELGSDLARLTVQVQASPAINDPMQFVHQWVDGLLEMDGTAHEELANALQRFDDLSETDKRIAAAVVAANMAVFDQVDTEFGMLDQLTAGVQSIADLSGPRQSGPPSLAMATAPFSLGECDVPCIVAQFVKVGTVVLALPAGSGLASLGAVALGVEVGLSILSGRRSILADQIKNAVTWLFSHLKLPHTAFTEYVYDASAGVLRTELAEVMKQQRNVTPVMAERGNIRAETDGTPGLPAAIQLPPLPDGQLVRFELQVPVRSVNESDTGSAIGYVAEAMHVYVKLRSYMQQHFQTALPTPDDEITFEPLNEDDRIELTMREGTGVVTANIEGNPARFHTAFIAPSSYQFGTPYGFTLRVYRGVEMLFDQQFETEVGVPELIVERRDGILISDPVMIEETAVTIPLRLTPKDGLEVPYLQLIKFTAKTPDDSPIAASISERAEGLELRISPQRRDWESAIIDLQYLGKTLQTIMINQRYCGVTIKPIAPSGLEAVPAVGGQAPFSFRWSNGSTTATINPDESGTYSVTVTDVSGCESTASSWYSAPEKPTIEVIRTDGINVYSLIHVGDEAVSIPMQLGVRESHLNTPDFDYAEVSLSTDPDRPLNVDLIIGNEGFTLRVASKHREWSRYSLDLQYQGEKVGTLSFESMYCGVTVQLKDNKLLEANATGKAPFKYLWNDGSTERTLTPNGEGIYRVTVTDRIGCESTAELSLIAPEIELFGVETCATRYDSYYRSHVDIAFKNPMNVYFSVASNKLAELYGELTHGYDFKLISGDLKEGVIRITYLTKCCPCDVQEMADIRLYIAGAGLYSNRVVVDARKPYPTP